MIRSKLFRQAWAILAPGPLYEPNASALYLCGQKRDCFSSLHGLSSDPSQVAFTFDIDGVLVKGKTVLGAARKALARLYDQGHHPKYPICFLTNGGGVLEETKAEQLSEWLNVHVRSEQVVAKSYGFKNTITTNELAALYPDAVPFAKRDVGRVVTPAAVESFGSEEAPIDAILVFSDSSNWYLDLQLMYDLILSGGIMGRNPAVERSDSIEIYFSNPDFVFSNEFAAPRFGQGALATALKALLQQGDADRYAKVWKVFGKPNPEPYNLAATVLSKQAKALGWKVPDEVKPPYNIFMIGDNPASDIAGASRTGRPWHSILVKTGVFQESGRRSEEPHADLVVEDVEKAVIAVLGKGQQ